MTTLQKHFFFSSLSCMCMGVGVIFPVALQLFRTSNWNRPMGRSSFVIRLGSIVNFVHSFNSQPIPCGLPRAARLYYPVLTILQGVVIKLKKKCPTFRTSGIGISDTCSIDNQSNCLVQQKKSLISNYQNIYWLFLSFFYVHSPTISPLLGYKYR